MASGRPVLQSITNTGGNNVSMNMTFQGGFVGNAYYAFSLWTTAAPTDDPLTTGTEYPANVIGIPTENKAAGSVPGVLGGTYYIWSAYKISVNSQWFFNNPPPTTVVVPDTPSLPGNMTFVSEAVVPGTGTIVVTTQSDVTGQTGPGPITQGSIFTFTNTYPPTDGSPGATASAGGNLWNSIFTVPQNQTVYFWASSTNQNGTTYSLDPLYYNSGSQAPVSAPGVPTLAGVQPPVDGENPVSFTFDTAGQTGEPAPSYNLVVGIVDTPADGVLYPVTLVSGTTYGATVLLAENITYYIWSYATNTATSAFSSNYITYNSADQGPPSAAPTQPIVVGTPTTESITVAFSSAGITGAQPISYTCFGALDPLGPFDIPTSTTNIGTLYTSVAERLQPNTNYVFQAYATNSAGVTTSSPSAFIQTANDGPSKAPTVPVVDVDPTTSQIVMAFNVDGITAQPGFPLVFTCGFSTDPAGPFNGVALVSGQATDPTRLATASNLNSDTLYYFVARATSNGITLTSGVSDSVLTATPSTNPFDFAYYPPRPWAAPNPVYKNGISQPWQRK